MQIFFQAQKIEIQPGEQDFMARRIEGLSKFFSPQAHTYIDVEQTRPSHNGQDIFRVAIHIEDGSARYFVDGNEGSVRKAFDEVYADLYRSVRNDRSRSRTVLKSAGRKFKNLFTRRKK